MTSTITCRSNRAISTGGLPHEFKSETSLGKTEPVGRPHHRSEIQRTDSSRMVRADRRYHPCLQFLETFA